MSSIETYHTVLTDHPGELARVRGDMRSLAERAGFGERAADVMLALDELIANAQEHGGPPVIVDAWADGRLVVEVRDSGRGFHSPDVWRSHPPRPLNSRGRGLWIVRQLADLVDVRSGPDGTWVRMELTHEPHIGA